MLSPKIRGSKPGNGTIESRKGRRFTFLLIRQINSIIWSRLPIFLILFHYITCGCNVRILSLALHLTCYDVGSVQTLVCNLRRRNLKSAIHHKVSATDLQQLSFTTKAVLIDNLQEERGLFFYDLYDWRRSPDLIMKSAVTLRSDVHFGQLC